MFAPLTGVKLRVFDARQQAATQREMLEQAIDLRVDGIIVQLGLAETLKDSIDKALAKGIKVVTFDVDVNDPTHRAAQAVAARLRTQHPGLEVRVALLDDDPAHALVAASTGAVLVVVGSRGLGAFRGMLLGSVSADVVRNAASTVLVLHDGLHAGPPD